MGGDVGKKVSAEYCNAKFGMIRTVLNPDDDVHKIIQAGNMQPGKFTLAELQADSSCDLLSA